MTNVVSTDSLNLHADSVLDLLIAQCGDLEALLALARCEEQAAAAKNFDELLRVVAERATLGERLEIYHRQIAELRQQLGAAANPLPPTSRHAAVAQQTAVLVAEIQATDARTHPLLIEVRRELTSEQQRLERSQRGVNAYLRDGRVAVACDRRV